MANKKISELTTRTPSLSDLILVGDPSNGFSYKCTVTALATIIETDISDGYVTLGTTQTISGAKTFSNNLTLTSVANATTDPDKFLVLNGSNIVNYRTGSEVLSDIGGQATISLTTTGTSGAATFVSNTLNIPQYQGVITLTTTGTSGAATLVGNTLNIPNYAPDLSGYVPTSRTITINGTTQDLTANRTYNVGTVTSVAASAGTGISISGSPITSSGTITITNTAPDQVVALTAGTGISISGTYPTFTITNSSPSLGGTVTSVALSAPTGFAVTGSPITSSGTLALAFDTGYSLPTTASQSNWDTAYTNRITSLTTTGSSGSATLISNTLNIPTYTLAGLGGISLTSLSAVQPLSYNNGTGAFSISQSNTSTDGYLSFTDWNTFNGKIGGSGTTSYVPKFTSSTAIGDSQIYDNGTSVGINTASPNEKLEVSGKFRVSKTTSPSVYLNITAEGSGSEIIFDARGSSDQVFYTQTLERLRIGLGGDITISTIANATIDTDKFLVSDSGVIKYRTGSEILSDIGGQGTLTLTTTGTSGAATLVGNTLNIPQYSGGGGTVSGTTNYIAKFTSSTAVGDSRLFDNGTITFLGNGDVNATPSTGIFSGTGGTGTNIAGAELRIRGGASTGNAAGGIISFYTSAAGSAGTGVNAATERMRITSAGLVGVGTSSPETLLHIDKATAGGEGGFIFVENSAASTLGNKAGIRFATNTGASFSGYGSYIEAINTNAGNGAEDITFGTWNGSARGERMRITSGGSLGIGTTTIGSTLQINGNAAIGYSASTAAPTNGLIVAGQVGVGVSPAAGFAIDASGTGDQSIRISTTSTGSGANASIRLNATTEGAWLLQTGNAGAGALRFYDVNAAADRMRIFSNGNIGINTLTAGSKLQVNGNAAIGYSASTAAPTNGLAVAGNVVFGGTASVIANYTSLTINGTSGSFTEYQQAAGNTFRVGADLSDGGFLYTQGNTAIRFGTNGSSERMRITNGGNVGIGTTTIGSKLQVNGNAAIGYSASTAAPTNGLVVAGNTSIGKSTNAGNILEVAGASQIRHQYTGAATDLAIGQFNASGDASINNTANGLLQFHTNGIARQIITSGGQITLATGSNVSAIAQTGYSLTGANAQSLIDLAGTWNTTGNPAAIKLNITNTASGATAMLMDLQVGGATQFRVSKDGTIRTNTPTGGTAADWRLGRRVAATVALDTTQYIEVEVGGTLYRLGIVT